MNKLDMLDQHRLNKEFDKVVCINLVNRLDKRAKTQTKFDELGISVEWFNAVEYGFAGDITRNLTSINPHFNRFNPKQPNEFGAAMSHYSVVKTALETGVEKLFVFEDDVMFRKDFNNHFNKYYDSLPDNWDMFLLYSFMYRLQPQNVRVNARWVKSFASWSFLIVPCC